LIFRIFDAPTTRSAVSVDDAPWSVAATTRSIDGIADDGIGRISDA
jgi:hypothetical protein